jgi:hypothetical protein
VSVWYSLRSFAEVTIFMHATEPQPTTKNVRSISNKYVCFNQFAHLGYEPRSSNFVFRPSGGVALCHWRVVPGVSKNRRVFIFRVRGSSAPSDTTSHPRRRLESSANLLRKRQISTVIFTYLSRNPCYLLQIFVGGTVSANLHGI